MSAGRLVGRKVVLVATAAPPVMVLTAMGRLRDEGARVTFVGPAAAGSQEAAGAADDVVVLRSTWGPVAVDPARRPRRYTLAWASLVARNLTRKGAQKVLRDRMTAAQTWWRAARHSPAALSALDAADVITALDQAAVYVAWQAARRNSTAAVLNGIGPTMDHLGLPS